MEAIDFKKDDFFNSKDKFDTSIGNSLDFDLGAGEFMSEESQKDLEDAKDKSEKLGKEVVDMINKML